MKALSLSSLIAVMSLSISAFAQECRLDYGRADLDEVRLSDDYRLAYLEYGSGEPVVLIHGAVSDYRTWQHQIEDLRRDYRVIALSLRASSPNSLSLSPTAPAEKWSDVDDVIELIEHLNVGRVHLIGHSAGGGFAVDIAVRRPDLLRTLVLEEPAVGTGEPPPPAIQNVFRGVIERIGRGETDAGVRDFINFVAGAGSFDGQSAECKQMMVQNAATISITSSGQELSAPTCATAGTIQIPVLYIKGEISPVRDSPFEMCLPPHDSVTISNASHGVHTDNSRQFNEEVRAFLGRH